MLFRRENGALPPRGRRPAGGGSIHDSLDQEEVAILPFLSRLHHGIRLAGAFVELEPGIDGLVHVSQIKNGWIENAAEVLKEGDEVQVKVMGYEGEKITLSIKELLPEEPVAVTAQDDESAPKAKGEKGGKFKKNKEVKEDDGEPREYVSENHGVTLGDIFKNLTVSDEEK